MKKKMNWYLTNNQPMFSDVNFIFKEKIHKWCVCVLHSVQLKKKLCCEFEHVPKSGLKTNWNFYYPSMNSQWDRNIKKSPGQKKS